MNKIRKKKSEKSKKKQIKAFENILFLHKNAIFQIEILFYKQKKNL